jgi:hypothetical protein
MDNAPNHFQLEFVSKCLKVLHCKALSIGARRRDRTSIRFLL